MDTFRCPTCLFVLTDPEQNRCPSCHKRLGRRGRPIVLGDTTKFGARAPLHIDLVLAERDRADKSASEATVPPPSSPVVARAVDARVVTSPPFTSPAAPIEHTTMYEPSQLDPEMRQLLDDLYRKARAELDDEATQETAPDSGEYTDVFEDEDELADEDEYI